MSNTETLAGPMALVHCPVCFARGSELCHDRRHYTRAELDRNPALARRQRDHVMRPDRGARAPYTGPAFFSHTDSQHGWLAVKRSILADLGILGEISRCSYQRGKTVYLEQDCDLTKFFRAWRDRYYADPPIRSGRGAWRIHSQIRSYARFSA